MPKFLLAVAALVLIAAPSAHAQQISSQQIAPSVEELTAPTAPVFVLMGITPESVDRPESPNAFVFSALSALRIGGLPTDFAMQVAPYWMKSNPSLTFEQYQNPDWRQSMKQTFAISVGTSPILDATFATLGTRLALGFTVRPWNGKPSAALHARRMGFFLTVSGGQAWDFFANDVSTAAAGRRGIWVTPAYRRGTCGANDAKCEGSIDLALVGRLLRDPGADAMVDVGGRLAWNPNREFSLSAEVVQRNPGETVGATSLDSTNRSVRTAGILQYKLADDLVLFGTFGQDFERATGAKPLLTLVGLNFGFGSNTAITR